MTTSAIISARGLTRVYTQGAISVHALRGVDLDVHEGEFTALVGPSGSGKSTLVSTLARLVPVSSGAVFLNEHIDKITEPLGLDVEIACRADELGQFFVGERMDFAGRQYLGRLEIGNGVLNIYPRGILREDGSDTYLEGCVAGPPVAVAKFLAHQAISLAKVLFHGRMGGSQSEAGVSLLVAILNPTPKGALLMLSIDTRPSWILRVGQASEPWW